MTFTRSDKVLEGLQRLKEENEAAALKAVMEARKEELAKMFQPAPPFSPEECTPEATAERLKRSDEDYWYWDATYFPPEMYEDYAPAGEFHHTLVDLADSHDHKAHVVAGPRKFAKTTTLKKKAIYDFLHGRRRYMAFASETLEPAKTALIDMVYFLETNERILHDYKIEWFEKSDEKLFAKVNTNPKGTFVTTLSAERSARGKQRGITQRLDFIYVTDFENDTSSLTPDAVKKRITRINEMRSSLADDGTLIWDGNNFHLDCAMNHLVQERKKGILSDQFVLHVYSAWGIQYFPSPVRGGIKGEVPHPIPSPLRGEGRKDRRGLKQKPRSLWPEKYPARSEEEMREMCKPMDEVDWAGNYQQEPTEPSGDIFPKEHYGEWHELPKDVRAVAWTDPNCSMKSKGDTTAMLVFGFSPSTQMYYATAGRCRSYFESDELLGDVLTMRMEEKQRGVGVAILGFDGNVGQESTWTNNVINYSRQHKIPFPPIEFKRYNVDQCMTSVSTAWKKGQIKFPPGFRFTEEGKRFTNQVFRFAGKKAKKKDDAPDAMICAFEMLHELRIVRPAGGDAQIEAYSTRDMSRIY